MTSARAVDLGSADAPFVLCDDGRDGAPTRLFVHPVEIVRADRIAEVRPALARIADAAARGLHAAGILSYEAGHALEPRLVPLARADDAPLLWFGLFDRVEAIARDAEHVAEQLLGGARMDRLEGAAVR